jgi:hypothetical protein
MPKMVDMDKEALRAFASMLVSGARDLGATSSNGRILSGLEALGLLSTRLLVSSQVIDFPSIVEAAVENIAQTDAPVGTLPAIRENLAIAYDNTPYLNSCGITLHSIQ